MSGINLKILILIIIILVLGGGLGLLAYNFFQPKLPITNQNTVPVNQVVENSNQNKVIDSYPIDDKLVRRAIAEKNTKYCEQTVEMTKDACIYYAAMTVGIEFCQQITDQAIKTKCLQYYDYNKVLAADDLAGCQALTDQEFRNSCLVQLFIKQDDLAYCANLPTADKGLCEDLINKNIAVKAADAKICQAIQDQDLKADCNNIIANLPLDSDQDKIEDYLELSYGLDPFKADTDGDGLSDYDELFIYKTNPINPDTDGDGYNDGEEVKSGHDPLKK